MPKYNLGIYIFLLLFTMPPVPLAMLAAKEGGWAVHPVVDFFLILTGTHGLIELFKIWNDPNKWTTSDTEYAQFASGMSF